MTGADQVEEPVGEAVALAHVVECPRCQYAPVEDDGEESHSASTISMTWLDSSTVPPDVTNALRICRIMSPDTGSTDSNGSSRMSSRGAWTSAHARPIFFVMPAE